MEIIKGKEMNLEKKLEMKWEKLDINPEYKFEIGSNVFTINSNNLFLCINKNNTLDNTNTGSNNYFCCEEINLKEQTVTSIFNKQEGPRFRITNVIKSFYLSEIAANIEKNKFYFYGGVLALNREVSYYLKDLWCFDYNNKNFFSLNYKMIRGGFSNSPEKRGSHSFLCDSEKNRIYLFGGKNEKERLNDLFVYDIDNNTFQQIDSITNAPIARSNHTAVIYKRSMIVYGGWDGTKTLNDMYELSLNTFIWYNIRYKSELTPPQVYRHAATVIGDFILIFGGVNEFNEKFNELYILNFLEKKWSILIASGNYPTPRTFHNICSFENDVFIFGGYSNSILNDGYSIKLNHKFFINTENFKENAENKENTEKDKNNFFVKESEEFSLLKNQVNELKQKYELEVTKNNCKICFEQEINTVILDCCHRYVCYDCALKCNTRCPACKGEIKSILKTYS